MMSSLMSSGRQDPPGQPAFSSDYLSGEGRGSVVIDHSISTKGWKMFPQAVLLFSLA